VSAPVTTPESTPDVPTIASPFHAEYTYVAGSGHSAFLRGLADGVLLARRCPSCRQVYLPSPTYCSRCLEVLQEPFEVSGRGRIATFCIVNFPFPGQTLTPPYVVAHLELDGVDTRLMHRIGDIDSTEVDINMEVEPVWQERSQLSASLESIRYFRPTGQKREVADA
jgi:uncharacterized OB-fold protein